MPAARDDDHGGSRGLVGWREIHGQRRVMDVLDPVVLRLFGLVPPRLGSWRAVRPERDPRMAVLSNRGGRGQHDGSKPNQETTHSGTSRVAPTLSSAMPKTGLEQWHVVGPVKLLSRSLADWDADAATWTPARQYADAHFRRDGQIEETTFY